MLFVPHEIQAEVVEAFTSTSLYLDDLLLIIIIILTKW